MIESTEASFDISVWMKGRRTPVWDIAGFASVLLGGRVLLIALDYRQQRLLHGRHI